jgi:hypothetical protein
MLLTRMHCAPEALTLTSQKDEYLLWITWSIGAWRDHFSWQSRACTPATREVKNHHLQNLGHEPPEMLQGSWTETWDTRAVQQEATFYCPGTDSANSSPKAEPWEQRGLHLIYPCRRLTHIWLHAILQATSLQCYVNFFTFRFSLSLCLCYAIPSPHYIIRTWLPASFLVFLPAVLQQCWTQSGWKVFRLYLMYMFTI